MPSVMAKKKPASAPKKFPSRQNAKYVYLPRELWDRLKEVADDKERSVSWMARRIIENYLKSKPE